MKILRMTATFGKLEGQTLELKDGLKFCHFPMKPENPHGWHF